MSTASVDFEKTPMAGDPECRADKDRADIWMEALSNSLTPIGAPAEEIVAAGMLLLHPGAQLRAALPASVNVLASSPDLHEIHRIIISGRRARWNDAVVIAIRAVFRSRSPDEPIFNYRDKIDIRATSRLVDGQKLVNTPMLEHIVQPWMELPEHPLKTRNLPRMLLGDQAVSRRQGPVAGYTAVRPRLPSDELTEILPSDWALVRENKKAGLDKILNRGSLVYSRESPVDRVPQPRVLLAFVINYNRQFQGGNIPEELRPGARLGALAHRMMVDLVKHTPFELMTIHVAVYVKDFDSDNSLIDHKRPVADEGDPGTSATCFDLAKVDLAGLEGLNRFDERIPFYLAQNKLRSVSDARPQGQWPALGDNPWAFLSGATAAISTYSAVLTVVLSDAKKWPSVFNRAQANLRPMEYRRDAAMLVETDGESDPRAFRFCTLPSLEAAVGAAKERSSDWRPRNALLDMLFGATQLASESSSNRVELYG